MRKRPLAFAAIAAAACVVSTACGGSSGGDLFSSAPDAQPAGSDGAPNPPPQSDGGADVSPAGPRSTADVDLVAPVFNNSMMLQVDFVLSRVPDPSCTTTTGGVCTLTRCPIGSTGPTTTYTSAGTVTVSGGSPAITISATPLSNGTYPTANLGWPPEGRPFSGGEAVSVTAQGGTVPAFTLPSFTIAPQFPLVLLLSQPAVVSPPSGTSAQASVPRDSDLVLAWSRGAPNVRLFLQGGGTNGNETDSLTCDADSALGQTTVTKELLSALPSGTQLRLFTVGSYLVSAGKWDVTFRVATDVATLDKKAGISLILQ